MGSGRETVFGNGNEIQYVSRKMAEELILLLGLQSVVLC